MAAATISTSNDVAKSPTRPDPAGPATDYDRAAVVVTALLQIIDTMRDRRGLRAALENYIRDETSRVRLQPIGGARMSNLQLCPHCGQLLPPTGPRLPPIKQRIYDAVRRRPGITAAELRDAVWADDVDGGPENFSTIHVHVYQLNKLLAPLGVAVRATRGAGAVYNITTRG